MKKSILNLGKTLSKQDQQTINGGIRLEICSYCGWVKPGVIVCGRADGSSYEIPCTPR